MYLPLLAWSSYEATCAQGAAAASRLGRQNCEDKCKINNETHPIRRANGLPVAEALVAFWCLRAAKLVRTQLPLVQCSPARASRNKSKKHTSLRVSACAARQQPTSVEPARAEAAQAGHAPARRGRVGVGEAHIVLRVFCANLWHVSSSSNVSFGELVLLRQLGLRAQRTPKT
jgi:hypothetical protein